VKELKDVDSAGAGVVKECNVKEADRIRKRERRGSLDNNKKLKQTQINHTFESKEESEGDDDDDDEEYVEREEDDDEEYVGREEDDNEEYVGREKGDEIRLVKRGNDKKRKRATSTVKKMKIGQSRYGPEKDRTCPFCKKVFSIVTGLAYHIEHKVCRNHQNSSIHSKGLSPFAPLTSGDQFITDYGIVQVVADDRAPPNYRSTPLEEDPKKKYRNRKRIGRIAIAKKKMLANVALAQVQRRDRLMRLNNRIRSEKNDGKVVDEEERHRKYAADVWAEYSTYTTPKDILARTELELVQQDLEGQGLETQDPSAKNEVGATPPPNVKKINVQLCDPGLDSILPKDSDRDRIVECVLIPDTRQRVTSLEVRKEGEGRISKVVVAKSITKATLEKEEANDGKDSGNGGTYDEYQNNIVTQHEPGMKLYLRRHIFTSVYNPVLPVYTCPTCGTTFFSRMGFKNHIDEHICKKRSAHLFEERRNRMKNLAEAVIDAETKRQFAITALEAIDAKTKRWLLKKSPPQARPSKPLEINPRKQRQKRKKHPSWTKLYPDTSAIYPEVYSHMGFKRGRIGADYKPYRRISRAVRCLDSNPIYPEVYSHVGFKRGRIKTHYKPKLYRRLSRAGQNLGADGPGDAVYPQIWAFLFVGIPAAERRMDFLKRQAFCPIASVRRIPAPEMDNEKKLTKDSPRSDIILGDLKLIVSPDTPMPPLLPPTPGESTLPLTNTVDVIPPLPKERSNKKIVTAEVSPVRRKKKRRKGSPLVDRSAVVDIQSIVKAIRAGRYPSISPYVGDHEDTCVNCSSTKGKLFFCEYCTNSEHLECVKTKLKIKDHKVGDEFMCHPCLNNMLLRRARLMRRRERDKEDREELMIEKGLIPKSDDELATATATSVSTAAKAAITIRREVVWSQSQFDCQKVSYRKCPIGGPGGLICCRPCSTAYSRFLVDTTMEMEEQSVSSVGKEVSELMKLLFVAQVKLQQSVDVTNTNEIRRSLLDEDEVENFDNNEVNEATENDQAFGIMDIFE